MKKLLKQCLVIIMVLSLVPANYVRASEVNEQPETVQEADGSVLCSILSSPDDLQGLIDNDIEFSSQDVITTKWSGTGNPHKIVVKEKGWIFITFFEDDKYTDCSLFSNFALTSKIAKVHPSTDDTNTLACYVDAGTYYYQISRWNGYVVSTTTSYVGFMPASARIKMDKITLSADKSSATVTFDYDENYLENFLNGTIRVVGGTASYKDIQNEKTWKTENRENALEKNAFYTTQNGTYTARIAGSSKDNYFCDVTFEIRGIDNKKPAAPKVTSYKSGSREISGTGLAGTQVYIKTGGSTYSATVGKNGEWKVTCKTKLKKGINITAYVKNQSGVSSKSTTVKVK
ncbi:Ig-like domain-containing protein [Anaerocolumna xylanovorans]|uniref:Bacterial Ig domain-containing protein n=1 Tax=Anaerocolumna xylanovorans DSM 12503 TaxID=1121345 RepID=A0A1M7Y6G4_9FIRM|nr:Ig-like domain-containing protein [Anaerocolumna xylanovorans]SHO48106.1 hypothetical protein SAMN02745217_01679 [Anaerocolumna xylanovorans DSM 12503]